MIGKWEEGKKWQKRVETLKAQCRDKDAEIEKLKKNNDMLRHAVDRLRVVVLLHSRLFLSRQQFCIIFRHI